MSYGTVIANPGAGGAAFAVDTITGVVFPRGKIIFGGEGVATEVTAATPLPVIIGDGTRQASVRDTGANDSLNVSIVDATGAQITTFGGGVQYTEGDTDATITGTAVMWEDGADTLRVASAAKPLPVDTELPAAALLADAAALPTTPKIGSAGYLYNGATLDLAREIATGIDSTGTGIQTAGMVAQFDDVAPTTVTENKFYPVRLSKRHNLYGDHGISELASSGSWTSATALNTAMTLDVTALSRVLVFVNLSGGVPTGGVVTFTGTTGGSPATGLGMIGTDIATGLSVTGSIALATQFGVYSFDVAGLTTLTMTLSSVITGAATVTLQARGIAAPGGGLTYIKPADGVIYTAPLGSAILAAVTHGGGEGDINLDVSLVDTLVIRMTGSGGLVLTTPYLFEAKDSSGAVAAGIFGREASTGELVDRYAGFKTVTRYYIFNVAGLTTFQLTQGTFSAGSLTISATSSAAHNPGAATTMVQPGAPRVGLATHVPIAFAGSIGDNVLGPAAVAGQTVRVMDMNLVFTTATAWKIRDASAGNDLTGAIPVSAGGSVSKDNVGAPHFTSAAGGAITLNLTVASAVNGWLKVTQGI